MSTIREADFEILMTHLKYAGIALQEFIAIGGKHSPDAIVLERDYRRFCERCRVMARSYGILGGKNESNGAV